MTKSLTPSKFAGGGQSSEEKMSKNLAAYLRLNKTRYKDQYVVLVDGNLVAKGKKNRDNLKKGPQNLSA